LYLAAAGVGRLGVADDDVVDVTNLQRQIAHGEAGVGQPKTLSAARAVEQLNSEVAVTQHPERLNAASARRLAGAYDLVVDGSDNFATRYVLDDACAAAGIPHIFGSIFRFEGQASVFSAREGMRYRDLYPSPPPPELAPSCSDAGVMGSVCGIIGSVMATEAIKMISGLGQPLIRRLLIVNALSMTTTVLAIEPRSAAAETDSRAAADDADECRAALDPGLSTLEVYELLTGDAAGPLIIDVRTPEEFAAGSIDGALNIPLDDLPARIAAGAVAGRDVVYVCRSGARSSKALSLTRAAGLARATHMSGGMEAWIRRQLRTVTPGANADDQASGDLLTDGNGRR
jgi:sulfur-carrier protein adenylyltransferase/sulfurtransferase